MKINRKMSRTKEIIQVEKWISLWSIGQEYSLEDIKQIKEHGFNGVEIWAEHHLAEQAFKYANECDLQIGLHLPFHDLNLATQYDEIAEYTLALTKKWIKKLAYYNGSHAVIHGGQAMASEDLDKVYPKMIERLKELSDFSLANNVELLFENQIPDGLNYMHILPSNIEEWLDVLNKTNTKACLDVGHLAIQGDEFKDTVNRLGGLLKSIHLSDNDGKSDLHLLPNDGTVIQNNIINVLSKQNYQGPVVFEINPYKYSLKDILEHPSVKEFNI